VFPGGASSLHFAHPSFHPVGVTGLPGETFKSVKGRGPGPCLLEFYSYAVSSEKGVFMPVLISTGKSGSRPPVIQPGFRCVPPKTQFCGLPDRKLVGSLAGPAHFFRLPCVKRGLPIPPVRAVSGWLRQFRDFASRFRFLVRIPVATGPAWPRLDWGGAVGSILALWAPTDCCPGNWRANIYQGKGIALVTGCGP